MICFHGRKHVQNTELDAVTLFIASNDECLLPSPFRRVKDFCKNEKDAKLESSMRTTTASEFSPKFCSLRSAEMCFVYHVDLDKRTRAAGYDNRRR